MKLEDYPGTTCLALTFDLHSNIHYMKHSNRTSTHKEEQLCQIILKSIHKYRSFGQTKTDTYTKSNFLMTMSLSSQAGSTKIEVKLQKFKNFKPPHPKVIMVMLVL